MWRYDTATGAWTQISPIPSSSADDYFGYSGLTIDRQHPDTIMVGHPDLLVAGHPSSSGSTDGGATWTRIWDWTGYPNRTLPLHHGHLRAPVADVRHATRRRRRSRPKLGWMTESLEIDPFNSNRLMYGTGATIYGTTNLTAWDTGGKVTIKPMAQGLEETAVLDLISPPPGAPAGLRRSATSAASGTPTSTRCRR